MNFTAQVAVDGIKGERTMAEMAVPCRVRSNKSRKAKSRRSLRFPGSSRVVMGRLDGGGKNSP